MLYAELNNRRIKPNPNMVAHCPFCKSEVRSKCGNINAWHWAHVAKPESCIYESMSEWHIEHQLTAEKYGWEIEKHIGNRIADCVFKNNVIEFQKSSISDQEILMRNINYDSHKMNIHWIFDYLDKSEHLLLTFDMKNWTNIVKFKQLWAKKSIIVLFNYIENNHKSIWGNVYFNFKPNEYIKIEKLYNNGNGWGKIINYETVLNECANKPKRFTYTNWSR